MLAQDLGCPKEKFSALVRRGCAPCGQGSTGGLYGNVDFTRPGQRNLGRALTGGSIDVVHRAAGGVVDALVADQQAGLGQQLQRRRGDGHKRPLDFGRNSSWRMVPKLQA